MPRRRLAAGLSRGFSSGAIVRWGLVALTVFTPLAFGTVEGWSIALLEWGIVSLVLAAATGALLSGGGDRDSAMTGVEWPLALYLGFVALQGVPLPGAVARPLAPGSWRAHHAAAEAPQGGVTTSADYAALTGQLQLTAEERFQSISVNRGETWSKGRLLACLVLLFLLVARWAARTERALFLLRAIIITGFVVALFGVVQKLTWNGKLYWVRATTRDGGFGPFVNHNHFAGYVEMILPLSIVMAYYLLDLRRRQTAEEARPDRHGGEQPDERDWLDDSQAAAGRWGQWVLALFAAILLLGSLVLCGSRGGLLSAALSAGLLFIALWKRIRPRALAWGVAAALPVLAVLLAAWIGTDLVRLGNPGHSVEREASFHSRWIVWKDVARHLPEAGAAGFGLGTFEETFAPYTPPGTGQRWDRAHNDYLQIAWETGGIGSLLILWGGLAFAWRYLASALRSPAHPLDLFRVAIAVSLTSLLLHSVVDFNLQIGSNAFLFALLAGLLVAIHRIVERDTAPEGGSATGAPKRLHLAGDPRILEPMSTGPSGGHP